MNWMMKKSVSGVSVMLIIGITFSCTYSPKEEDKTEILPYYADASFTPHWLTEGEVLPDSLHSIPPFRMINQDGDSVSEGSFIDKIYVVNFFFTSCPGICPKMTANMTVLQDTFMEDEEVLFLSHSVTPETDSVAILKNYAEKHGIVSGKWHLVTGEKKQIYHLGRHEYFVEEDLGLEKNENEFLHTENFILVDKQKHIRGIYNGLNKTSVNQLVKDIRALKQEI